MAGRMNGWNPFFAAYAADGGLTPQQAIERDLHSHPSAHMGPFLIWIQRKWREWFHLRGLRGSPEGALYVAEFSTWLCGRGWTLL